MKKEKKLIMSMEFKEENGLIYYFQDEKWKIAGRKNHPLTKRFIQLLKGESDEDSCICRQC